MVEDRGLKSLADLVEELTQLIHAASTGSVMVRSMDNHWACLVLEQGKIISVMHRGVRGAKGLAALLNLGPCSFHFQADKVLGRDAPGELPETRDILLQLMGSLPSEERGEEPVNLRIHELRGLVLERAIETLGPIAEVICEEQFADAGIIGSMQDLDRLLRCIARDIDNREQAEQFREAVMTAVTRQGTFVAQKSPDTRRPQTLSAVDVQHSGKSA